MQLHPGLSTPKETGNSILYLPETIVAIENKSQNLELLNLITCCKQLVQGQFCGLE